MVVAGARHGAIKLASVFWWLERFGVNYVFVWSGQHYDYEMSRVFFEQLRLPEPAVDLDVRSGTHAEHTAKIMMGLEEAVDKYKLTVVVTQGDTNTVVAAALTAAKKQVPFAHVETGLMNWDRTMPEEINRIVADAVAHLCFAPTALAATNLMHEGVPTSRIHITGNTIVDVVHSYKDIASEEGEKMLKELGLQPHSYVLVTIHRQENTDNPERLQSLVNALAKIFRRIPVVFPAHPHTEAGYVA
jgi:UDP-N-acetylglucosamine 2-epimerase (non-hydrolysing)